MNEDREIADFINGKLFLAAFETGKELVQVGWRM